jgi:VanZ family protein
MRYSGIFKKKRFSVFSFVLLFFGISGIIFFVTFDFFKATAPHYIPGRSSSLFDLMFNGLGAFGGIIYYHLEKRGFRNN